MLASFPQSPPRRFVTQLPRRKPISTKSASFFFWLSITFCPALVSTGIFRTPTVCCFRESPFDVLRVLSLLFPYFSSMPIIPLHAKALVAGMCGSPPFPGGFRACSLLSTILSLSFECTSPGQSGFPLLSVSGTVDATKSLVELQFFCPLFSPFDFRGPPFQNLPFRDASLFYTPKGSIPCVICVIAPRLLFDFPSRFRLFNCPHYYAIGRYAFTFVPPRSFSVVASGTGDKLFFSWESSSG